MIYIVLAMVAVLCFAFCIYMMVKVENEPTVRHRPAWQDEDADEETKRINYRSSRRVRGVEDRSTPWRYDPPEEEELPEEEVSLTELFSSAKRSDPPAVKKTTAEKRKEVPAAKAVLQKIKKAFPARAEDPYDAEEDLDEPEEDSEFSSRRETLRKVQRVLDILCGILFAIALALMFFNLYLHSLR